MNSQQSSNRQAETTQILRKEWGSFLDRFSELNRETTTRVELLGPEPAAYELLLEERPLLDITLDDAAGPPQLIVECGDTGGSAPAAFRHLIQEPTAIRARGYGADDWDALEIESRDMGTIIVTLNPHPGRGDLDLEDVGRSETRTV